MQYLLGKVLARPIIVDVTGEILADVNQTIDDALVKKFKNTASQKSMLSL